MAESHFTEISNIITFYQAQEASATQLLSLPAHEFGAAEHQSAEAILAAIDEHPGAVLDFELADTLGEEGLDRLIALMMQVMILEKRTVRYVRRLEGRVKAYEDSCKAAPVE